MGSDEARLLALEARVAKIEAQLAELRVRITAIENGQAAAWQSQ